MNKNTIVKLMSFCLKALFALATIMFLIHPASVFAQTGGGGPAGISQIEYMFARVVCVTVPLGYIALLVVLVIAGFKYLTSGGEPKAVQAAHQTVTWGLLGILFLAIAWLILLLIQNFTGVEVTKFSVSSLPGVQGFTGQCIDPAPIAPEPAKHEATTQISIPFSELPQTYPQDNTQQIPTNQTTNQTNEPQLTGRQCQLPRHIEGIDNTLVTLCKQQVCDSSRSDDEAFIPISEGSFNFSVYSTPEGIAELSHIFRDPEQIHVLAGSVDNKLYWFYQHLSNATFGKFRKDEIPYELIKLKAAALKVRQKIGNYPDNIVTAVNLEAFSCHDFDYYVLEVTSPLLYFYPLHLSNISLKVDSPLISQLIKLDRGAWNLVASPDGILTTMDGKKYRYIPYEFLRNDFKRPVNGSVIEGGKLEEYLRKDLWRKLGLTDSEISDYWQDTKPRVKPSPYYFISLIDRSEIDRVLPMEVNPKPDTIIRNMTYILPLSSQPTYTPQPLEITAPQRNGFTVLENGVFTDGF